jgi:beta-lactamase superfamily II metal-dependent hydrolase
MAFGSPLFPLPTVFNGIEVDMLSLGDADSIIVTKYENGFPHRILIDGGSGKSAEVVVDFMLRRKVTEFFALICTHAHKDHAKGLIKIVQDKRIKFQTATFNDIRHHIATEALRRASASNDGVGEVVETTKELSAALSARNIPIYSGIAGNGVAKWPKMTVLGPSLDFYRKALEDFTKVDLPIPAPFSSLGSILGGNSSSALGLTGIRAPYPNLLIPPPPNANTVDLSSLLKGALSRSSVKEEPKTQPFNNTSMILGVEFAGQRLLFTADAGSEALDRIPPEWKNLAWMQVPHHGSDGNLSKGNIEKFCPKFAFVSAGGDSDHPSRAIVNGLIKCGAEVCSTHSSSHIWYYNSTVPARPDYGEAVRLKATGDQKPIDWTGILLAGSR